LNTIATKKYLFGEKRLSELVRRCGGGLGSGTRREEGQAKRLARPGVEEGVRTEDG